jgi:hypothetical protein
MYCHIVCYSVKDRMPVFQLLFMVECRQKVCAN